MKTNGGASAKSYTYANEQDKPVSTSETEKPTATQLTETTLLENTPFIIVRVDEKYFVGCGKYRLTHLMDTEEEAIEYAEKITWNNITAVIGIICEMHIEDTLAKKAIEQDHQFTRLVNEMEERAK